jgi:hypothetical protein
MMTEMDIETSVYYVHLTRLVAREDFIKYYNMFRGVWNQHVTWHKYLKDTSVFLSLIPLFQDTNAFHICL